MYIYIYISMCRENTYVYILLEYKSMHMIG